jgi:5-methylcytosine-specific restriction endonuclease McrA
VKPYIRTYYEYFNYVAGQFVACECCGAVAKNIHHITYRSHFGKKTQSECNDISNLMALCVECHNKAHDEVYSREYLQKIHNESL